MLSGHLSLRADVHNDDDKNVANVLTQPALMIVRNIEALTPHVSHSYIMHHKYY